MVTFEVTDLEACWSALAARGLAEEFPGVRRKPPTELPWGREARLIDPAGVCRHVRQCPERPPSAT
jgi:hypothetical protein